MRRIPPNGFGIPFGRAGLGGTWSAAADARLVPHAVGTTLLVLAAAAWVAVLAAYLAGARPGTVRADLTGPVTAPFLALVVVVPMILAARGLAPVAPVAGRVLTDVLILLTVLHGCWFTGQLISGAYTIGQLHPGYFLPTVAGGLIASASAAQVGQADLAWTLFGYGVICWLVLGSMILGRLFFAPPLPATLVPTIAIEVAPSAVASLAWFSLTGGRIDTVARLLAGYGLLIVVAQLRLLPTFLRLRFSVGFWAFTFSWAAVATATLHWITETRPVGGDAWALLVLVAVTLLVAGVAVRSVVALRRGMLFPRDTAPPAPPPTRRATAPVRSPETVT